MRYVRVYADEAGESHFEDVEVALTSVDHAPPAPPLHISASTPASGFVFLVAPPDWDGAWHPAPMRQMIICLAGEVEAQVSDGGCGGSAPGARRWSRTPSARATAAGRWAALTCFWLSCSCRTKWAQQQKVPVDFGAGPVNGVHSSVSRRVCHD